MRITLWPSKTHEIKRAYGLFYSKPFPTVGTRSCADLNASHRVPLDILCWMSILPRMIATDCGVIYRSQKVKRKSIPYPWMSLPFENALQRKRARQCRQREGGQHTALWDRMDTPTLSPASVGSPSAPAPTFFGYPLDGLGNRTDQTGRSSPIESRD